MPREPFHPVLPQPWTFDLVRIDWRPSPHVTETWLDLTFRRGNEQRRLRFLAPTEVRIEAGFQGQCAGLAILDIRCRGWDRCHVQVVNLEQAPGITFYAADVADLDASR